MNFGIGQTVTNKPKSASPPNVESDVANLGFVRPPLIYLVSLAVGLLIQLVIPLPVLPRILAIPLGAFLVVLAIPLVSYSFSRNPIYLAFSLLQLGIAIWINSVWLLVTLVGALALMHYVVIPREEQYLERKFGAQYLDYKTSVRRWL